MTLPSSGTITSTQIATELGVSSFVVPTNVRVLCRKPTGSIIWPTDFYGEALHPNVIDSQRFGATASPGNTFTIPTVTGNGTVIGAGDLVVVSQYAQGTTATPPIDVTLSGWTVWTSYATGLEAGGDGYATKSWYKILAAGEGGDVKTVLNGTGKNRVCGIVYHFDKTPTSAVAIDTMRVSSTGAIGSTAMTLGTQAAGTHIIIGMAHGDLSVADADFVWSQSIIGGTRIPSNSPKGTASQTRTYFSAYDNNVTVPASVSMSLADNGAFNSMAGIILRVRN